MLQSFLSRTSWSIVYGLLYGCKVCRHGCRLGVFCIETNLARGYLYWITSHRYRDISCYIFLQTFMLWEILQTFLLTLFGGLCEKFWWVGKAVLSVYIETGSLGSVVGIISSIGWVQRSRVDLLFLRPRFLRHGAGQCIDRQCCYVWGSTDAGFSFQHLP